MNLRSTLTFCTLLAPLLALPSAAASHDLPRERTILFEISKSTVEAMIVFQEPPGKRIKLLKAQFDFDGNGRIEENEANAAASSWVPYALQDLEIRIDGEERRRSTSKIKFRNEHNGALSSAIYLEWEVSDLGPSERRSVVVRRSSDAPSYATLVRSQTNSDAQLTDAPGPIENASTGPYRLAPGDELEFVARHGEDQLPLPTRRP